jgi:hypothetical protein
MTDAELDAMGERYSKTKDARSLAEHLVTRFELLELVTTYVDKDAHRLLDLLRDRFWASDECQAEQRKVQP